MEKRNRRHEKRVKRLLVGAGLCATILSVSTYAWFIGMKTVNVTAFDVEIAAIDGLSLSLDGKNFGDTVTINESNYSDPGVKGTYLTNTNSWGGKGLIPMSTVGKIDTDSSNLILFEKGSFTASPGGYRVMASQVENDTDEQDGYVAFDLFVKNLSGNAYYDTVDIKNEEGIYLTPQSVVKTGAKGQKTAGIENSVRVAFAQIGRVKADTTSADNITKITCANVPAADGQVQVTGICRDAQIWEPNDTKHVQNAINWYQKSCLTRKASTDGDDVNDPNSYNAGSKCTAVEDGTAYPTYAISNNIEIADNVNIYDGAAYNTYTKNTVDYKTYTEGVRSTYNLVDMTYSKADGIGYFTDTMKNVEGKDRPQFMTLAPNSITKLRVYVWIEGQDIDNYDFASLGKKITINFGFTKERYNQSDFPDYDGPDVPTTNE